MRGGKVVNSNPGREGVPGSLSSFYGHLKTQSIYCEMYDCFYLPVCREGEKTARKVFFLHDFHSETDT